MNYTAIPNDRQDQATTENNRHITNRPKVLPEGRVLYNCQISTHTLRYPYEFKYHYLEHYVGGSAAKLIATNTHPDKDKKTESSSKVTAKRSAVTKFSFKARRRLLLSFSKINRTNLKMPKMLTLTYPATYSNNFQDWKKHLDEFCAFNFHKLLPNTFSIWKLEPQKRGAPHFHLLIFSDCSKTLEMVYQYKEKWKKLWYEIVGSQDPNHLKVGTWVGFNKNRKKRKTEFKNWDMVSGYVSKYLGKTNEGFKDENGEPIKYTGRYWGIYNRNFYKQFIDYEREMLTGDEFKKIKKRIVDETCLDMSRTAESHRFKMDSSNRQELDSITAEFDSQYQRILLDVKYDEGEIRLDIPDCYHVKRFVQLHKQKRTYQTRATDTYGIFSFVPHEQTSQIVGEVLNNSP